MLYLLHAAGYIEELPDAASAEIDQESRELICLDTAGREVARYPFLAITMYSPTPLPSPQLAPQADGLVHEQTPGS